MLHASLGRIGHRFRRHGAGRVDSSALCLPKTSSTLVIPEGAGPCQASDLGLFAAVCWVPGTGAGQALVRGRGQGSTEGRPRRGLALMPAPRWRSVFVPGGVSLGCGVAACSNVRCGRMATFRTCLVAGHPFATGIGWHGVLRPQPGGVNQIRSTTPPAAGVRPGPTSRPGCVQTVLTPVGPGNGCARHAARSRPG